MAKKKFGVPLVFLTTAQPMVDGGGTGDSGLSIKPLPCKFEEWLQTRWFGDYDQDGDITQADYAKWWAQNGFGQDTWAQYNPDVQWNDEWTM